MRTRFVSMLAGALLLAALPAQAHHSFAAEFDEKQPVTLRGTLTKMEWFNPHGWIYIDVKEPDGKVTNWGIEAGSPTTLLQPTRSAGTSERYTFHLFSQRMSPVSAFRQMTSSCSCFVSGL